MNLKISVFLFLLFFTEVSYGCGFFTALLTSKAVPLDYVGNIEFKPSYKIGSVTQIPVTFNAGKWNFDSAICLNKIKAKVEESNILISVVTCVCSPDEPNYLITLKNIKAGNYQLIYKNPDNTLVPLGSIQM